jgi:hypothetical protein
VNTLLASAAIGLAPACPPDIGLHPSIRAYDVEDRGGRLTATHTIALEAHDRGGLLRNVAFTLPPSVENRGTEGDPAFSVDTPGRVPVTATWSHYVEGDGSTCTASADTTLRIEAAEPLKFTAPRPGLTQSRHLGWSTRAGNNADLRPVEVRLRGVRRAHKLTLALRRGDDGVGWGSGARVLRAVGWSFHFGLADVNAVLVNARAPERGRRREFAFQLEFLQAGRRVGRTRASGACGPLGCSYRIRREP